MAVGVLAINTSDGTADCSHLCCASDRRRVPPHPVHPCLCKTPNFGPNIFRIPTTIIEGHWVSSSTRLVSFRATALLNEFEFDPEV